MSATADIITIMGKIAGVTNNKPLINENEWFFTRGKNMISVLDIGSNTIRLVTYENKKPIKNISIKSEILADTVENNLTQTGTQKLCDAINILKKEAQKTDISAFATFAFRQLENKEEVKREVFEKTGVEIDILSGKEEAQCDFLGLINEIQEKSGIGIDLGGGSCQLFAFSNGECEFCESYSIGCKKVKEELGVGVFPNAGEIIKIQEYVDKNMGKVPLGENFYAMGGTAKATAKMYKFLKGEDSEELETDNLLWLIEFIKNAPEELMKSILKERFDNIIVGMIILMHIAKKCGAKKIWVKKCSVRDGYIIKNNIKIGT